MKKNHHPEKTLPNSRVFQFSVFRTANYTERDLPSVLTMAHLLFLLLIFISSCSQQNESSVSAPPPGKQFNTIIDADNTLNNDSISEKDLTNNSAQIPLEENETLIELFEINLDKDQDLEQVTIIRVSNGNQSVLQLRILDYLVGMNQFEFIFTQDIDASKLSSITVNVDDLTQDRENEIIFSAFDEKGFHILKILSIRPSSYRLQVNMIFDKRVDGLMEIVKNYGDESHSNVIQQNIVAQINQQNGDSVSITRETYIWDKLRGRYVMSGRESVIELDAKEERVQDVLDSTGPESFEEYLDGPWYREVGIGNSLSETEDSEDIIFFDAENLSLSFFSGGILENYIWKSSQKNVPSKLYISATNSLHSGLPRNISVTIRDFDTISLNAIVSQGDRDWDGTYRRLNEVLITTYRKKQEVDTLLSGAIFSGLFESSSGQDIYFDLPQFEIYDEQEKIKSGTAALFSINGDLILQLKTINSNGLVLSRDAYLVDYREITNNNSIIRTLNLKQGTLSVDGIRADLRKEHTYEQIEFINKEEN